ncbi:10048_t:CDS:2, partial [Scutellospora calospora]
MDPSLTGKVTVIMFRAQHTELPEANIGSIFVGTGLRVSHYMNAPQLIAYKVESTCTIMKDINFRANRPLDLTHQRSAEIMAYAEHLRIFIMCNKHHIVEIHRVELITELYITDYTCNELLCNNNFVWRLPDGLNPSNVLQISLWDEHVNDSNDLEPGMFVYLENIRTKYHSSNQFQGVMHGDSKTRRTRLMQIDSNSSDVIELITRKELFMQKRNSFSNKICTISKRSNIIPNIIPKIIPKITLPHKFLTRGRIADFLPPVIENFIRLYCAVCD